MAGKYKLDRTDIFAPGVFRRHSGHKTLSSAMIELGRDARRQQHDLSYRIVLDGQVVFNAAAEQARTITGDETIITG